MKKGRMLLWVLVGILLAFVGWRSGWAVESLTITEVTHEPYDLVTWTWVTDADGGCSDDTTVATFTGRVVWVAQLPDAGATQPTNAYDITITDEHGIDVLNGLGANISNAANSAKTEGEKLGAVVSSTLFLEVQNAGDSKGGSTVLVVEK